MNDFFIFFQTGLQHITDGFDHMLFVAALCLHYNLQDWKKLLILITAFTIGHSITLALSVLNIFTLSTTYTEFLIPLTIAGTALYNLCSSNKKSTNDYILYVVVLLFGLVHGMGFSYMLKSMLGRNTNVVTQLLAFNIGLEAGQLIIVLTILIMLLLFINIFKIKRSPLALFINGGIFALALQMAIERSP